MCPVLLVALLMPVIQACNLAIVVRHSGSRITVYCSCWNTNTFVLLSDCSGKVWKERKGKPGRDKDEMSGVNRRNGRRYTQLLEAHGRRYTWLLEAHGRRYTQLLETQVVQCRYQHVYSVSQVVCMQGSVSSKCVICS